MTRAVCVRLAVLAAALLVAATSAGATGGSAAPRITVLATGLDQPKKLTIAADGDVLVALSGDGAAPRSCTDGNERSCLDESGAIDQITPAGHVTRVLSGLPSISSGVRDPQATGPVQARRIGRSLLVLFQNSLIDQRTGAELYGRSGTLLDELVRFGFPSGARAGADERVLATFGPFEARNDPDHGAGTDVHYGLEEAIDSDPYSFVGYRGGYAVADAGANDLLFVSAHGTISLLAVFPTIREHAVARTYGPSQKAAIEAQAQAVPTAVAVGPDGALYVGELGGLPYDPGTSVVYRIVPGRAPTVYASGFTAIGDLAFDRAGRLLVLELDQRGLDDPGLNDGRPASGELIRVARGGRSRAVLIAHGLDFPTGLAVAADGDLYVSEFGTTPARSGHGGELVRVSLAGAGGA